MMLGARYTLGNTSADQCPLKLSVKRINWVQGCDGERLASKPAQMGPGDFLREVTSELRPEESRTKEYSRGGPGGVAHVFQAQSRAPPGKVQR